MTTYVDGRWLDDSDATVSVRSRALNYGLGCFGGIRGYVADDGHQVYVFRLDEHVRRFSLAARALFLQLPASERALAEILLELVRRNDVHHDVYLRPLAIHDSNELAPILDEQSTSLIAYCLPLARYIDKDMIDVCISSWRRVADNAIPTRFKPTAAYLNSALARREAHDNGFDEAVFVTEGGSVSEGSAEHVFVVRDGALVSPPSTEDNLDGITRRSLITLAVEDLGLTFDERTIGRSELYFVDEMFLCGTGAQVTPVRSVDRRPVGDGQVGPITRQLHERFQDVVHGRVASRMSWLFPVWG
jgi:branched-chain amino acid aminotransferase